MWYSVEWYEIIQSRDKSFFFIIYPIITLQNNLWFIWHMKMQMNNSIDEIYWNILRIHHVWSKSTIRK